MACIAIDGSDIFIDLPVAIAADVQLDADPESGVGPRMAQVQAFLPESVAQKRIRRHSRLNSTFPPWSSPTGRIASNVPKVIGIDQPQVGIGADATLLMFGYVQLVIHGEDTGSASALSLVSYVGHKPKAPGPRHESADTSLAPARTMSSLDCKSVGMSLRC